MAGVEGLEPPTSGFGDRRSSQLSYTPTGTRREPGAEAGRKNAQGIMSRGRASPGCGKPLFCGLCPALKPCVLPRASRRAMERVTGIEPAQPAWKAGTLPLSYTRGRRPGAMGGAAAEEVKRNRRRKKNRRRGRRYRYQPWPALPRTPIVRSDGLTRHQKKGGAQRAPPSLGRKRPRKQRHRSGATPSYIRGSSPDCKKPVSSRPCAWRICRMQESGSPPRPFGPLRAFPIQADCSRDYQTSIDAPRALRPRSAPRPRCGLLGTGPGDIPAPAPAPLPPVRVPAF